MELCEHCDAIDFHAAGLHAPGDPDYNFFSMNGISFRLATANAKECFFCEMVSSFFVRWADANYGGVDRPPLLDANVAVCAEREKSIEEIEEDDSQLTSASLFKIAVTYEFRNPNEDELLAISLVLQKCATEEYDVASVFEMPFDLAWPEHREPYLGRIRPLLADCRLFKKWKDYCATVHNGEHAARFSGEKLPRIRLVDVKRECVVELTGDVKWITLSYVWGNARMLILEKHSLSIFQQPGFLSRDIVPRTIYDAMILTAALGETYLWVDCLCILQDDPVDKLEYLPKMDAIYGHATLTIIDAAGSSAHGGLPGMRQGSRTQRQMPFQIKGVTLVQTLDPINIRSIGYLTESEWNSRGWTLQEGFLSSRTLIFTAEQVYWQCKEASWCEDGFWECPNSPQIYRHGLREGFRNIWSPSQKFPEKRYRQLVEVYSQRTLTFESDALDAFRGVLNAFERDSGVHFFWGLPTVYLGAALTWPALDGIPRRRTAPCEIKNAQGEITECLFPSWSWMGWVGIIHFDEVFGLLTSRHAGVIFYRISSDGKIKVIRQNANFKEKYDAPLLPASNDEKTNISEPYWRDGFRTAITKRDIPSTIFVRNLSSIVLAFWSSTLLVTVQYLEPDGEPLTKPKLIYKGAEIKFPSWGHVPQCSSKLDAEDARLIIIGRNTLCTLRGAEQLVALVANVSDDEGLSYRKGMVTIKESVWNDFGDRTWERIILI